MIRLFLFGRVCVRAVRINRLVPIHIHNNNNNRRFLGIKRSSNPDAVRAYAQTHTAPQTSDFRLHAFIFCRPKHILDLFCCFQLVGNSFALPKQTERKYRYGKYTIRMYISDATRYRISAADLR